MAVKATVSSLETMTIPGSLIPQGYQQLTGMSAATKLTPPTVTPSGGGSSTGNPRFAVIQAEAQNVRWRDDGVAPTATIGMLLVAGTDMVYTGDLSAIQFIQATGGAILNVSYYDG